MLTLRQAGICVSGFGFAIIMEANADQQAEGFSHVVSITTGTEVVGNYAACQGEVDALMRFKRVLRKWEYAPGRFAVKLQL